MGTIPREALNESKRKPLSHPTISESKKTTDHDVMLLQQI
jgi:hypothetical protein